MPTSLPVKHFKKQRENGTAVDNWIGAWAVSVGLAASLCALFVYFGDHDQVASTFILCAAAFLIHLATVVAGPGEASE
ncbi:MAG TPA: hypothetical protein VFL51_01470 [Pseudolabrys sp.]|nr:hypothetical protein [Pseudolabrys sp.]